MLPQTLQVAVWLLYIDGVFAVLGYMNGADNYGKWRNYGGIGGILAPVACLSFIAGGFLIANGRKVGWYLGIAASLSPFLLRALYKFQYADYLPVSWVFTQQNYISFLFEVALIAVLVHPMSRSYAARWLR